MISEYLDGRIVCLECTGVAGPSGEMGMDQVLVLHRQGEKLPETSCEHVRAIRRARWEAKMRQARQAGEDLTQKLMLQAALNDEFPDEELAPGQPPEWMQEAMREPLLPRWDL